MPEEVNEPVTSGEVVEPTPEPTPEPAVEPAPEPVVEPVAEVTPEPEVAPEPAVEPVVEAETEPVDEPDIPDYIEPYVKQGIATMLRKQRNISLTEAKELLRDDKELFSKLYHCRTWH